MNKKLTIGLIVVLIFLGVIWGCNIIKCEILTLQHKDEFVEQYKQTNIINNIDYLKIISYDNNEAAVYYVSKNKYGNILKFKNIMIYGLWTLGKPYGQNQVLLMDLSGHI